MNPISTNSFLAIATVLAIGASALPAVARTVPASIGHASYGVDQGCFEESFGSQINNCNYTAAFAMALPVDRYGTKTAAVSVYAPDVNHGIGCAALASDPSFNFWGTPISPAGQFGVNSVINVSMLVPQNGAFEVVCWPTQGARVNSITYNE